MKAVKPSLHPSVAAAIHEQQERVWRLRNLLDALRGAIIGGANLEDEEAALDGLIEYADQIHLAMDAGPITERATWLDQLERGKVERNARHQAMVIVEDDGGQTPPPTSVQ